MRTLRARSALIDGEAVWCGPDGAADFDVLHGRAHDDQVFMYAFDLLELDGEDLRTRFVLSFTGFGPGCVKTPRFNLRVEILSRFSSISTPTALATTVGRRE
jgi:hypothetical protein